MVIILKFFLNQLIQFYSNNATNVCHLTSHSTPCCPTHNIEMVMWPQITVTHFTLCVVGFNGVISDESDW